MSNIGSPPMLLNSKPCTSKVQFSGRHERAQDLLSNIKIFKDLKPQDIPQLQ